MGVIQRQGLKGTVVTGIGVLLGILSILWVQPYFLSPEEIGLTRVLFNLSALIAVFMPLGMANATTRFFPLFRDQTNGHHGFLGILLLFILAGSALCGLILFIFSPNIIATYQKQSALFIHYFHWVYPLSVVLALIMVFNVYSYSSILRATVPSIFNDIIVRVLLMALFLIYSLGYLSLDFFVVGYVLTYFIQLVLLISYVLIMDKVSIRIDWKYFIPHLKQIVSFGVFMSFVAFGSLGIKMIDSLILAGYSLKWVGIYSIAAFIPNVIEIPVLALDKIAGSVVSINIVNKNWGEVKRVYTLSVHYLFLSGGLLFLLIIFNVPHALKWLPSNYSGSEYIVLIAGVGALFQTLAGTSTAMLFNSESFVKAGFSLIALVAFNLGLNLLFIPRFGMIGAAMATAISSVSYTSIRWILTWYEYRMHPFTPDLFKIALLIGIVSVFTYILPAMNIPFLDITLRSLVICLLYGLGVWIFQLAPEVVHRLKRDR